MPRNRLPILLTPETADALERGIADGVSITHAALSAGVSRRTLQRWLQLGRSGQEPYSALVARLKTARAAGIAARVARITDAARATTTTTTRVHRDAEGIVTGTTTTTTTTPGQWQADAWYLERVYPTLFGTQRREIAELRKMVNQLLQERGETFHG